jgi:hypothetical protein
MDDDSYADPRENRQVSASEGPETVAPWVSRLGLEAEVTATHAVREAVAVAPEAPDVDTMRLLTAAALSQEGGARGLVDRLAKEPGRSVAALAAVVGSRAAGSPHPPLHVFAAVARSLLDPQLGLMSDDAYGGMAGLQAAACRTEVEQERFARDLRVERSSPQPLLASASWRAVVDGTAPSDGWQMLFDALESRDAEPLVDAALGTGSDSRTALAMVRALAQKDDPRLFAAARSRFLEGLRLRLQDPNAYEAQQIWSQLDPEACFEELARRADASGILDQRLLRLIDTPLVNGLREEHRRSAAAAFERIVRRQIALGVAPFQSLDWWLTFDREAAGRWLSTALDPAHLESRTAQAVVRPLQALATPEAIAILRSIQKTAGPAAESALASLEVLEAEPQDRIERVAARFRAGEGRALRELHDTWIDRCGGRPFAVWRTRLGVTSRRRSFWVRAADGTASLFIEIDKDDRLAGWSMR